MGGSRSSAVAGLEPQAVRRSGVWGGRCERLPPPPPRAPQTPTCTPGGRGERGAAGHTAAAAPWRVGRGRRPWHPRGPSRRCQWPPPGPHKNEGPPLHRTCWRPGGPRAPHLRPLAFPPLAPCFPLASRVGCRRLPLATPLYRLPHPFTPTSSHSSSPPAGLPPGNRRSPSSPPCPSTRRLLPLTGTAAAAPAPPPLPRSPPPWAPLRCRPRRAPPPTHRGAARANGARRPTIHGSSHGGRGGGRGRRGRRASTAAPSRRRRCPYRRRCRPSCCRRCR